MPFKILNGLLDPDEREMYILRKIAASQEGYSKVPFRDPVEGIMKELQLTDGVEKTEVEPWLIPTPPPEMRFMLTVENFVTFMDSNGCLDYSNTVRDKVRAKVFPEVPLMFGVDHSLSGGVIEAAVKEHGGENVRLVVFDSHFDFILPTIRCGLIQYDMETNPHTKFTQGDPYVFNRQDSYNADSFLSFVQKMMPPENILVVGVSDYPPKAAEEIGDERVRRYVEFYKGIASSGVRVIRKEDVKSKNEAVKLALSKTDKPYTYVSIDVDVCANAPLRGARFLDCYGLDHSALYGLVSALKQSLKSSELVGLDFMEFDVYNAGALISGKVDRTYQIMAEVFRRLSGAVR